MEHAPAAHGRGYYATRTAVRALTYTTLIAAFYAVPGAVELAANAIMAGLN